jgi:hypothetical protein
MEAKEHDDQEKNLNFLKALTTEDYNYSSVSKRAMA